MSLHGLNSDSSLELTGDLPAPVPDALNHSKRLLDRIHTAINANDGCISFRDYMQYALYEPGLGYYSAGCSKFGDAGDFITAPELSELFSQCLARQCRQVLQLTGGDILEFGAGSGRMAGDIMRELDLLDCLPGRYLILETSADLRERQYNYLNESLPEMANRFEWLDALPEQPFKGVVLANEVLDAMPVHRLVIRGDRISEACISWQDNALAWTEAEACSELVDCLMEIRNDIKVVWPDQYVTEINLSIHPWINSVAGVLHEGLLLVTDYGYTRKEYYHPQRRDGTLICHYRHRAHGNPLLYPGLQDITASVDFTLLAGTGNDAGMQVLGFTNQGQFLLGCGLDELLAQHDMDSMQYQLLAGQAKQLTLPGEMGERYQVMALGRGLDVNLLGFRLSDQRYRL